MSDITLSKAVRSNLLSLQNTADMMSATQNRLATGKKVNSALDNPSNFFTASSLNSRAGDINQLLDGMANGIQTLEAADNGLKAVTKTLESMQSTLRQARQDKSFQTSSFTVSIADDADSDKFLTLSGGAVGDAEKQVGISTATAKLEIGTAIGDAGIDFTDGSGTVDGTMAFDIAVDGGSPISISIDEAALEAAGVADAAAVTGKELVSIINSQLTDESVVASLDDDGALVFTSTDPQAKAADSSIIVFNSTGTVTGTGIEDLDSATVEEAITADAGIGTNVFTARKTDELVAEINETFAGQLRASNDNGKLRIENLSTQDLTVGGATAGQLTGADEASSTIEGNSVRAGLTAQYNELRDQLDKLADDASFNGINLLRGDNLKITFNEIGTSEIDIQSKEGKSINSASLGIPTNMEEADFDTDAGIDAFLGQVKTAINEVRSQSSAFGSSLSIVQNRQDFSKNMINTLQTGAANLTLADSNEEAANLLALQTRQQLSSTALSMASQADQAVLRLF
jgi:flagellin